MWLLPCERIPDSHFLYTGLFCRELEAMRCSPPTCTPLPLNLRVPLPNMGVNAALSSHAGLDDPRQVEETNICFLRLSFIGAYAWVQDRTFTLAPAGPV